MVCRYRVINEDFCWIWVFQEHRFSHGCRGGFLAHLVQIEEAIVAPRNLGAKSQTSQNRLISAESPQRGSADCSWEIGGVFKI